MRKINEVCVKLRGNYESVSELTMKSTRLIKRIKRAGENINVRGVRIKRRCPAIYGVIFAREGGAIHAERSLSQDDRAISRPRPYFLMRAWTNRHDVLRATLSLGDRWSRGRVLLATINSSPDNKVTLRLAQVNFSPDAEMAAGERFASDSVQRNGQRYPTL